MISLSIRMTDGSRRCNGEEYENLSEACRDALNLADQFGRNPFTSASAQWVDIIRDGELEISIAVIGGGFLSPGCLHDDAVQLSSAERSQWMLTREKPTVGVHDTLTPPDLPPFP